MNSAHQSLAAINSTAKDTCLSVVSVVQRVKREQFAFDAIDPSSIPAFVKLVLLLFPSHTERHLLKKKKKLSKYLKSGNKTPH